MGSKNKPIPVSNIQNQNRITFSFRFYDTSNDDYCLSKWGQEKIADTLKRLQDINSKTYNELHKDRNVYHFHPVDWSQTIKKSGFPTSEVNSLDAFQFALLGVNGQKARVYGAISQDVFYVVWFDIDHKIWPTLLKHT